MSSITRILPTSQSGTPVEPSDRRLQGIWLLVARVGSGVIVAFALTVFVASLPVAFSQLHLVCTQSSCPSGQLTTAREHSLHHLGMSIGAYATFAIVFTILTSLVWFGVATVIFWRRSDNLVTLLVAVQLVTQGASGAASSPVPWERPLASLSVLNVVLLCLFLAVFPNGRFVPRWIGWILIPASVAAGVPLFTTTLAALPGYVAGIENTLGIGLILLIAAQLYRYRFVSTSVQRQQTKWVIAGIGVSVLMQIGLLIPTALVPSLSAPDALYPLLAGVVSGLALTLGPIAFMFAVLRYRLYDIDLIINRTLVYGSLTAILAAIYVVAIVGSQALARGIVHQESSVAIVVATLAAAALFQPLRSRIQASVDRRFYRHKYDAQKTLTAFTASLRQEVDLDTLKESVLSVVQETMQPDQLSLWLRPMTRAMTSSFTGMGRQGQTASKET